VKYHQNSFKTTKLEFKINISVIYDEIDDLNTDATIVAKYFNVSLASVRTINHYINIINSRVAHLESIALPFIKKRRQNEEEKQSNITQVRSIYKLGLIAFLFQPGRKSEL
jgi:Zn-dependent peptidase ImmA (M78 family)